MFSGFAEVKLVYDKSYNVYFLWHMYMHFLDLAISNPKKYIKFPIVFNLKCHLFGPATIISSTYINSATISEVEPHVNKE